MRSSSTDPSTGKPRLTADPNSPPRAGLAEVRERVLARSRERPARRNVSMKRRLRSKAAPQIGVSESGPQSRSCRRSSPKSRERVEIRAQAAVRARA